MSPELKLALQEVASPRFEGWCTYEKAEAMASLVLESKPECCVELGVFGGRSLVATALALKENNRGVVWGIDPWVVPAALEGQTDQENIKWWSSLDIDKIRNDALNHISRLGLWNHCKVIVAKSEDCCRMFGGIDILHIDGNHSDENAFLDVDLWLPLVKRGGYVWFDDIDWGSTQRAVRHLQTSFADRVKEIVVPGSSVCALFQKR